MNELQLVGYTADLRHLVLSDAAGASRFKVPVDSDLLATVEEVVGLTDPDAELLAALRPAPPEPEPPPPPPPAPEPSGPKPGEGSLAGSAILRQLALGNGGVAESDAIRTSKLSPRQIQALLRSGKTPKSVASQADVEEAWVLRWLPPIEAERDQVLMAVQQARVSKARLGPSRDLLGEAIRRNLASKGVDPSSDAVQWTARRRDGHDMWTVELRYRNRGRSHRAVWGFDPEAGELEARNDLAESIAWTRPRSGASSNGAGGKTKPAKRASAAKKATGKRAAAKKATGKRAAAKKSTAKRATKKSTVKRAAKKSAAKRNRR